jgi:hypothetical protein
MHATRPTEKVLCGVFRGGNYPGVPLPEPNSDPPADDFFVQFAAKHAIQTLNAWKFVFLGLDKLQKSINILRTLLGILPNNFDLPSGSWWSLREIDNALGDVFPEPTPTLVGLTAAETIGRMAKSMGAANSAGIFVASDAQCCTDSHRITWSVTERFQPLFELGA